MNIPSFKQFIVEEQREIFFTFGRMNPPTIGHGKLLNVLSTKSGKNPYRVYMSQSQDAKKNPLTYEQKVKHVRKMFPKHARSVILDKKVRNVFDIATKLYDEGFVRITMVVGEDRVTEFETLLNKYNGTKARHGFYNFEKINVISAGQRDPDAEGVEGMSASKQRENAKNNDFTTFSQGVPKSMSNNDAKKLFNDVRAGMGLSETRSFRNHVDLEPVSEVREKYIEGEYLPAGTQVVVKESLDVGTIFRRGTNYVILEMEDDSMSRQWLDSVEPLEERYGSSGFLKKVAPEIISFLDTTVKNKKFKSAVKRYIELTKKNPNQTHKNVVRAAQIFDLDIRTLDKYIHKMRDKGIIPNNMIAHEPMFNEAVDKEKVNKQPKKHTDKWYKDQPEWGTPEATKKAKTKVPGQGLQEKVSRSEITALEKFADRILKKFDIDVKFTRHFGDRVNDARNNPDITMDELRAFFNKIAKNQGNKVKALKGKEAVLKDMQADLNLPVIIKYNANKNEFQLVHKTIMRKKGFKTSNPVVQYESAMDTAKRKIQKDRDATADENRREKEQNKKKYDRILDRARLARARKKNKGNSL